MSSECFSAVKWLKILPIRRKPPINQSECFYYFAIIPPLIGITLGLKWSEFPTCKDVLCEVWLKLTEWFYSKSSVYFLLGYLSTLKTSGRKTIKYPLPKDELCQVKLKWIKWPNVTDRLTTNTRWSEKLAQMITVKRHSPKIGKKLHQLVPVLLYNATPFQTNCYIFLVVFMPPLKRGQIVLQLLVGRSVCRPSNVRSISFDPFTWSIPNLVQGWPSMSRWSLLIFRSHVQSSRSNHCFVLSPLCCRLYIF